METIPCKQGLSEDTGLLHIPRIFLLKVLLFRVRDCTKAPQKWDRSNAVACFLGVGGWETDKLKFYPLPLPLLPIKQGYPSGREQECS